MELTHRLLQIEQMAALLGSEAAKARKEIEKGQRKKVKDQDIEKQAAEILSKQSKNYKTVVR